MEKNTVLDKFLKVLAKILVACFLISIVFTSTVTANNPNEYALVKQFGAVVRIVDTPGAIVKIPFIQTVQKIPKNKMIYDIYPSEVNTSDKKIMKVDSFVIWEITDPLKYLSTLGANQANAETRLSTTVYNSIKTVISATSQDEVISGRNGQLAQIITDKIGNSLDPYGIQIIKVETKMLDLVEANKASVYERMISERNNIAAGFTSEGNSKSEMIKNETDKEVSIKISEAKAKGEQIKAEGEAEYMQILSAAYNDESKADYYNYIRSLDALKISMKGTNKTLILDKDSEFAKILMGE